MAVVGVIVTTMRFLSAGCGRAFFSSISRVSYRRKKPRIDPLLMQLLCSGVSMRGYARLLGLDPKSAHRKLLRLARHCRKLSVVSGAAPPRMAPAAVRG